MDDDRYGAFVSRVAPGPALPGGPLAGARLAVKDLIEVAGHVTRGGNPDWARGKEPASQDAEVVARLLGAGARFVGKTHTDELSRGIFGETSQEGMPANPRAPGRVPGGSSSGSAVAVAAGLADIALGTDTGGSVRVPASFCGIPGFRPTHGRVPFAGVIPQAPSFDTLGWFARDGALLEAAGKLLLDPHPAPEAPTTLWRAEDMIAACDPAVTEAFDALWPRLSALLPESGSGPLSMEGPAPGWFAHHGPLQSAEAWASFKDWIDRTNPRFTWEVANSFMRGASQTEAVLAPARAFRAARKAEIPAMFQDGRRLYAFPATPFPAPPAGLRRSEMAVHNTRVVSQTCPGGFLGLPQLVLPLAEVDGLPLGIAFLGAPGSDEALLALAARLLPAQA
ncbi:amidase [Acetobacteraceae bacterium H6797]|nr:amidase [Acetobacteraceae bacterium H6797]